MRIALLTDGVWPLVIGGMQKHSYYLCKHLLQAGIQVDLYHPVVKEMEQVQNVFTPAEQNYLRIFLIPFPSMGKLPGHYLRASKKYSRLIAEAITNNDPADLIYAKGLTSWELLTRRKYSNIRIPVCINVHGYEYFQKASGLKTLLQQLMIRASFKRINILADYIVSYGGGITRIIKSNIPNAEGRIIEIPAGIEEEAIIGHVTPNGPIRKFVFMGRYERRKGIEELLQILNRLVGRKNFEFHFIGEVPELLKVKSNQIIYHGVIKDYVQIQNVLALCNILVCPSYSEGMPNVIMEAMASGCAIIATDTGAVDLLVSAKNGWLIEAGSATQLEACINQAINISDETLLNMREASLEKIRQFTWKNVARQTIKALNEIAPH